MSQIDDSGDCREGELQRLFDGALASLPPSIPPDPFALHQRLRRRRIRARVAGLTGLIVMVSLVVTVGVAGASDPTSATMTLYARDDGAVSQGELSADAKIIRDRLNAIGDQGAGVSESEDAIVITGGADELRGDSSVLTESPMLLVRPLLCQGGPFDDSTPPSPQALPLSCAAGTPDALEPDSPERSHVGCPIGHTALLLDPALSRSATTTPSADSAHPSGLALLPVANGNGERDLVGPTQLTLSSGLASAKVDASSSGAWLVDVSLTPAETALLDAVAARSLPLQLAVDLDGEIVSSPNGERTGGGDGPSDTDMELAGPSQAWAEDLVATLQSGPLPIPLKLARAA